MSNNNNNKMLIDAAHPEETRVVVLRDGRVEEFDYESAARKLLRGNIYLAKVTRVEPSLQAAFVDYGGNRHGFLAFSEIHPDYYQIPVADRELLKQEEAAAEAEAEAAAEARAERRAIQQEERRARVQKKAASKTAAADRADALTKRSAIFQEPDDADADYQGDAEQIADEAATEPDTQHTIGVAQAAAGAAAKAIAVASNGDEPDQEGSIADVVALDDAIDDDVDANDTLDDDDIDADDDADDNNDSDDDPVEEVGSEDAMEEMAQRPQRRARQYKIQEVIKRRQVLLVQVVKEERGNKGAALTTYLSLAGRYTVLMPNSGRGGGISRKIANGADRKRLKAIALDLDVPEGMGLIIRTAGASRTKAEIKRDFEYLLRLWESVRELTLTSSAPNLVYEEGNLIKRSIRDLYNKEIDEILVAGPQAHREAKDYMGMLMPSHARNVVAYKHAEPLFAKYQIERQLNAMFSPYVTLRSGGYIVINQTEALVSVDVNSGKATREFSIERTAVKTNLEAAEELSRQLKLRDLAGLIVIDFIDMEDRRNNRAVEKKIKDCLKHDRARIQVGRISHFGLMEMSRQRMRTGVLEGSTTQCTHCEGTGAIRSTESVALSVLRALEDTLLGNSGQSLTAVTSSAAGFYILNHKRAFINEMEERYGVTILIAASDAMHGASFSIEKSAVQAVSSSGPKSAAVKMEWGFEDANGSPGAATQQLASSDDAEAEQKRPRRRRRGKDDQGATTANDRNNDRQAEIEPSQSQADAVSQTMSTSESPAHNDNDDAANGEGDTPRRARRRGRRGGRRNREQNITDDNADQTSATASASADENQPHAAQIPGTGEQPDLGDLPALHDAAVRASPSKKPTNGRRTATRAKTDTSDRKRPRSSSRARGRPAKDDKVVPMAEPTSTAREASAVVEKPAPKAPMSTSKADEPAAKPASSKKGWWQRAFSSD